MAVASPQTAPHATRRRVAEGLVVLAGLGLLAAAAAADTAWFDRHFLPDMFSLRPKQLALLWTGRATAAALGLALILFVRPCVGRFAARRSAGELLGDVAPILVAILLAVGASELILRSTPWRAAQEARPTREPLRRRDPTFGWLYIPNRAAWGRELGGRRVLYALDPHGYRVSRPGQVVDLTRPTVVFTGESIVFGHGLTWDESIPGQVERLTGLQSADLAVQAYAPDQAYLRLRHELPRFERPVAVVTIFIPPLFGRILDDDRPHLGPGLQPLPEAEGLRLVSLARRFVPYRSAADIERGVALTRAVYRSTRKAAEARGAVPIILVPTFQPEPPQVAAIRRKVLDEAAIPYLLVPLDGAWRIPGDKHPDARGDRAMAQAIVQKLLPVGGAVSEAD